MLWLRTWKRSRCVMFIMHFKETKVCKRSGGKRWASDRSEPGGWQKQSASSGYSEFRLFFYFQFIQAAAGEHGYSLWNEVHPCAIHACKRHAWLMHSEMKVWWFQKGTECLSIHEHSPSCCHQFINSSKYLLHPKGQCMCFILRGPHPSNVWPHIIIPQHSNKGHLWERNVIFVKT